MGKNKWIISLVVMLLLCVSLACNLLTQRSESSMDNDLERLIEPEEQAALLEALAAEVADHRPEIFAYLGQPDAFDIAIVVVEGEPVRMESWRYYQFGTQVDFVDGNALWVVEIDPMPAGTVYAAWYNPLDFFDGISGTQAVRIARDASPTGIEPQRIDLSEGGEDLMGGFALVGDQIVIGLYDDQVIYVETIAFVPEGGVQ